MTILLDAAAVFRLTRLVTTDRVTRTWRNKIEDASPDSLGYFIQCPHCVSIWVAAGVVVARRVAPRAWGPVAELLAFSAVTSIAATWAEK